MNYVDYYLKANNQASFEAAVEGVVIDGALDVIGVTYRNDTPEGEPPVARDGYLANLRLREGVDVPDSLKPFLIDAPENPVRVFA